MSDHGRLGPIEWATAASPVAGEKVCGDHPIAVYAGGDAALFGVVDGLGHGTAAATAAQRAVALKDKHKFKTEMDSEALDAMFPHLKEKVA